MVEPSPSTVCLGDAVVDVFVALEESALAGSDANGVVRFAPGGSAANVAVWLARLGATSSFIGATGDDFAGAFVRAELEREHVLTHLMRVPAATAAIAVLLDATGERTMITDRAAATMLSPAYITFPLMPPRAHLHLPAYSLFVEPLASAAMAAVDLCRAAGGTVAIDTSSVAPLQAFGRDRFLALIDRIAPELLFANAKEGAFLSGTEAVEAGTNFLRRFAPVVIWKLGAEGAAARGDQFARVEGIDVPVLDTTGAGDAFAASFTFAHLCGLSLNESLRRANVLASTVVQHIGARPRLATQVLDEQGAE